LLIVSLLITSAISLLIVSIYAIIPNFIISTFAKGNVAIPTNYLTWMGLFICFYTVSFFMINFFLSIDETKIVLIPAVFAILQIILICLFHGNSLLVIIQISLVLMVILFVLLMINLVYNRMKYV
jgi:hypothetical protein